MFKIVEGTFDMGPVDDNGELLDDATDNGATAKRRDNEESGMGAVMSDNNVGGRLP